jgi:hypothetical protein
MHSQLFTTKNEVIGKLRISGFNMKEFALAQGYRPDTVRKVVSRYAGSTKKPRGEIARRILQKLEEVLAKNEEKSDGRTNG